MSIELPAAVRPARLHCLPATTTLFRVHHQSYPGATFNPCQGGETRFAPLRRPDGTCIPTLYVATSFDGAAYETVFWGIPNRYAAIPRQDLDHLGVSRIAPKADLQLVPLFTPELKALGIDPMVFFAPSGSVYPDCRAVAQMAWRDNPSAHGLIWSSIRDSSAQAMLLFGDRLSSDDFDHLETREIATDPTLLSDFVVAGVRGGFSISR